MINKYMIIIKSEVVYNTGQDDRGISIQRNKHVNNEYMLIIIKSEVVYNTGQNDRGISM